MSISSWFFCAALSLLGSTLAPALAQNSLPSNEEKKPASKSAVSLAEGVFFQLKTDNSDDNLVYQLRLLQNSTVLWQMPQRSISDEQRLHFHDMIEDLNLALLDGTLKISLSSSRNSSHNSSREEIWLSTWFKELWHPLPNNIHSLEAFLQSINWQSHPSIWWNKTRQHRLRIQLLQNQLASCQADLNTAGPIKNRLSPALNNEASSLKALQLFYQQEEQRLLPLLRDCRKKQTAPIF